MPASCVICHRASGLHSPDCPIGQQLKGTRAQLLSIAEAHRETEGARRRGNRGGFNPALRQVNLTAFPAFFHPLKGVPVKLSGMNAHNVVLEMDATYEDVVSALQRALFYAYIDAEFELCTSDGALIAKGIPLKLFPFLKASTVLEGQRYSVLSVWSNSSLRTSPQVLSTAAPARVNVEWE
ncbi:Uncharacterized protein PBTT_05807 [Plasmodiophora brassicae]